MHSAIYKGWVRHRRFHPREHKFSYRVFMMYLDLAELQQVLDLSPWWSQKPWRPARFVRSDFLGDAALSLEDAVRARIQQETGVIHRGPIRMLANLRYFGFNINPISCYYCFDEDENLRSIVTEVTNTPWNERRSYVLSCDAQQKFQSIQFQKELHVSPFNPMDMTYKWHNNKPSEILSLSLETLYEGNKHMDANLALKRHEINPRSLAAVLLQYPWMTARVAYTIYWQALRLWLKKVPFVNHPKYSAPKDKLPPTINNLKTKA